MDVTAGQRRRHHDESVGVRSVTFTVAVTVHEWCLSTSLSLACRDILMASRFGIAIRRDTCLLPASSCNGASSRVQLNLVSRRHIAEGRRVETLRGTTVLLYAKHHQTSDWFNLLLTPTVLTLP